MNVWYCRRIGSVLEKRLFFYTESGFLEKEILQELWCGEPESGSPFLLLEPGQVQVPLAELWATVMPERPYPSLLEYAPEPPDAVSDEDVAEGGESPSEDAEPRFDSPSGLLNGLLQTLKEAGMTAVVEAMQIMGRNEPAAQFLDQIASEMVLAYENPGPVIRESFRIVDKPEATWNHEDILAFYQPDSTLQNRLDGFRYRTEQAEMARCITEALDAGEFLIAEAGTGVGKSLAYLIPAITWAVSQQERVVVSTRTKVLQRQLAEKDIPLLEDILPFRFQWTVAYGRENYLCQSRWRALKRSAEDTEERRLTASIVLWLARGGSGLLQDLAWLPHQIPFWAKLNSQRFNCAGSQCPHIKDCLYQNARKSLVQSDLVVVNHALLLSEVTAEGNILPEYHHLIVDEAHNLERTAFDHLGVHFGTEETRRVLRRMSEKKEGFYRGFLPGLQSRYPALAADIRTLIQNIDSLGEMLRRVQAFGAVPNRGLLQHSRRITDETELAALYYLTRDTGEEMAELERGLTDLADILIDTEDEKEIRGFSAEIGEMTASLYHIAESTGKETETEVCWAEFDQRGLRRIAVSPLEIGQELNSRLYEKLRSAIFVSATLSVSGRFDFMKTRTGIDLIDPDRIREWRSLSPFDYENHAQVLVIRDAPDPSDKEYAASIAACVRTIAQTINKRSMVLFTSRAAMSKTISNLEGEDGVWNDRLLAQYRDGEIKALLTRMRQIPDSILFGTETFWEGVDLPGDLLNCLVITRLPFRPPSEPLTEAMNQYYRRMGKDGFAGYNLPDAVIRFCQGLGRLIRSEQDTGLVIILDPRFCRPPVGKRYGQAFRDSMPMKNVIEIRLADLESHLAGWFGV